MPSQKLDPLLSLKIYLLLPNLTWKNIFKNKKMRGYFSFNLVAWRRILVWSALALVVRYSRWFFPNGITIRLIFSYSARAYFPFPIFLASLFRAFQVFADVFRDWRLYCAVRRFFTPFRCPLTFILPFKSVIVA